MSSLDEVIGHIVDQKVAAAVAAALADFKPRPLPALLTTKETCEQLRLSRSTLDRLRMYGLPCVFVGEAVRFNLAKVCAWLEANPMRGRSFASLGAGE